MPAHTTRRGFGGVEREAARVRDRHLEVHEHERVRLGPARRERREHGREPVGGVVEGARVVAERLCVEHVATDVEHDRGVRRR